LRSLEYTAYATLQEKQKRYEEVNIRSVDRGSWNTVLKARLEPVTIHHRMMDTDRSEWMDRDIGPSVESALPW
jgi:citrate lyase gamma subunit